MAAAFGVDWHGFLLPAATQRDGLVLGRDSVQPVDAAPELRHARLRQDLAARDVHAATSAVNGVNCSNPSGHGLFISRQTWRTW